MRRVVTALALSACSAIAAAECSVGDRVELSKAGYSKAEIEALCLKDTPSAAKASPASPANPVAILQSARYDSSDDPALRGMWHPRNRCEFLDDQVKLNNIKKTFGGYKSSLAPYRDFWATSQQLRIDRQSGIASAHVLIMAMGFPNANETCYALLDRRVGLTAEQFDRAEAEVRQSFRDVLDALRAMGVDMENPQR